MTSIDLSMETDLGKIKATQNKLDESVEQLVEAMEFFDEKISELDNGEKFSGASAHRISLHLKRQYADIEDQEHSLRKLAASVGALHDDLKQVKDGFQNVREEAQFVGLTVSGDRILSPIAGSDPDDPEYRVQLEIFQLCNSQACQLRCEETSHHTRFRNRCNGLGIRSVLSVAGRAIGITDDLTTVIDAGVKAKLLVPGLQFAEKLFRKVGYTGALPMFKPDGKLAKTLEGIADAAPRVHKVLGVAGTAIDVANAGIDAYEQYDEDSLLYPDMGEGEKIARAGVTGLATGLGSAGGAWVGAEAGLAIGTFFGGPVGAAVGGLIGGFAGSEFGQRVGEAAAEWGRDAVSSIVDWWNSD
ncbi:MAG: hypothetical protein Q4P05_06990 [Actinomycetaceae bacterium]|nr:hypothetical protein [Actinomycetaceae bacterium]